MGVDCKIYLPDNVQIHDVARVMGIAAGLPFTKEPIGHEDAWSVKVEGAYIDPSRVVTLANISLSGKLIDGEFRHDAIYHFEASQKGRLLMPRSTAFWIGIGRRLVDFFGGHVDYNDCDEIYDDYIKIPKSRRHNSPQDGKPWQKFQQRIAEVKPLTQEELIAFDIFASYKMKDM